MLLLFNTSTALYNMYIKLIEETSKGIMIEVQLYDFRIYKITLPTDKLTELKSSVREIKIGITSGGIDTKDPKVISEMDDHGEHVALADLYMKPDGFMYRMFWHGASGRREKQAMIDEYIEQHSILDKLSKDGFKELDCIGESDSNIYHFINKEISKIERQKEIDSGRFPCIGETYGCYATTSGSQYCCKTHCPFEIENM
jgi:hypothetical protein